MFGLILKKPPTHCRIESLRFHSHIIVCVVLNILQDFYTSANTRSHTRAGEGLSHAFSITVKTKTTFAFPSLEQADGCRAQAWARTTDILVPWLASESGNDCCRTDFAERVCSKFKSWLKNNNNNLCHILYSSLKVFFFSRKESTTL